MAGRRLHERYLPQLLQLVLDGKIDTTDLISRRPPLEQAPEGYKNFKGNQNEWTKVVLKPWFSGQQPQAKRSSRAGSVTINRPRDSRTAPSRSSALTAVLMLVRCTPMARARIAWVVRNSGPAIW